MVDILISFDSTGSMFSCLSEVRNRVSEFVKNISKHEVRVAVLTHGDYCDRVPITSMDFTTDLGKVVDFVKTAPKTSGGDYPEFYEHVLEVVEGFDWKSEDKVLIMIGDAYPHNETWKNNAKSLINKGIMIYPVQCLGDKGSNYFWQGLANLSNTPKLELHQFSDIVKLLTAVFYKQQSNEQVFEYAEKLRGSGQLNRNVSSVIQLLTNSKDYTGGISFETDLEAVDPYRFQTLTVPYDISIRDFVEDTGAKFQPGKGFYQLNKRELIQENKEVVLIDKNGDMFSGDKARELIGLPYGQRGNVKPVDIGYEVFVQSTSYNRKLQGGTKFLYEIED